jgi:hypothetical protein
MAASGCPCYTSYPPSPFFSPAVMAADYRAWLAALTATTAFDAYLGSSGRRHSPAV